MKGLYLAIATLGFGEVVRVIFLNLDVTNGALGLSGIPSIPQELTNFAYEIDIDGLMGIDAVAWGNLMAIIILLAILVFIIAFCVRINNSRVGRAFAAIKADDHAAELMGINVVYYKMMASSLVHSLPVSVVVCMLILQTLSILQTLAITR